MTHPEATDPTPATSATGAPGGLTARPFVGRQGQWAELEAALGTVASGRGALVFVTGEPGIGKTRMVDEFAACAAARGTRVAWGRCWETGGAPAYFPIAQALRALWRSLDDGERQALAAPATAPAAQLLPELVPFLSPPPSVAPPGREGDPNAARFELFEAVAQLLRTVSTARPVLLALDDLHASDRSSLALLSYLTRDLRSMAVMIVGTFRDVEARLSPETSAELGRISREGILLSLPRLDRAEAGELVRKLVSDVDSRAIETLYRATQGNPLFISEMLRGRALETGVAADGDTLPHGVRELIRQRLAWLSAEARQALEIAAALGHEFLPVRVAEIDGREVEAVEVALAAPRAAGIVVERGERRLGFGHALFREVLYRDLPASRRRALHAAILAAAERRHAGDPHAPYAELAHHALEAGPDVLARAVEYASRAADAALAVAAYEDAVLVLERAYGLAADHAYELRPRAEALLALGLCRIRGGDGAAGREACRQTAELARGLDDGALFARAALAHGTEIRIGVVDPTLVSLLEEALQRLAPDDDRARARVLARLAGALQPSPDPQRPIALAREAIATARRTGDEATLLGALHAGMAAMMDYVEPAERAPLNREIVALATRAGDGGKLLRAHARLVFDLVELPDLAMAAQHVELYSRLADETRLDYHRWRAPLMRAMLMMIDGRFAEAETMRDEAARLGAACHSAEAALVLAAHRGFTPLVQAEHSRLTAWAEEFAAQWLHLPGGGDLGALNLASVAAYLEDMDAARLHLAKLGSSSLLFAGDPSLMGWCAEPVAFVRDLPLAERLLARLPREPGRCLSTGMSAHAWMGPVARHRGLLLAALGRWDEALAEFAEAHAELVRLGARPYRLRLEYEWARALMERGRPADVPRVRSLLQASLAEAGALGMPVLQALVLARLTALAGKASPDAGDGQVPEAAAVPAVPESFAASEPLSLVREGEYWTLTWHAGAGGGAPVRAAVRAPVRLKDSRGLRILSQLIEAPGRDIPALDLAAQTPAGAADAPDGGDAGEWLDEDARRAYRQRMVELREDITEAEERADQGRLAVARAELEALSSELSRAVGLGGRARRAGSAAERARVAVQRRIKDALGRIDEAAPEAGRHLARTIYTGLLCSYRPTEPRRIR